MYSIVKVSKQVGVSNLTLRLWDKEDILKPSYVTKGETRYYSEEQVKEWLGKTKINIKNRIVIGYYRVRYQKKKLFNPDYYFFSTRLQ